MDINQTDTIEPVVVGKIPSTTMTTTTSTSTSTTSTTPVSPSWDDYDLEKLVPPIIVDDNNIEGEKTDFSAFKPNQEDDQSETNKPIEPEPIQPIKPETIQPIKPEVPRQPEIQPITPRHPAEVRPLQPIEPEISRPIRPETRRQPEKGKSIEPNIPTQSQEVKPIIRPSQPEQPKYEPQQPEVRPIEPKPTDPHISQPDHHIEKSEPPPTPPQVVFVDAGKETATIDGKKMDDGSVVVDTHDLPKNEWTRIKGKPSYSCPPGFEADHNGVCLGK